MQLGFVSAILWDLSLEEVFSFAAEEGFTCVELMCWPAGGAERRYAGRVAPRRRGLHRCEIRLAVHDLIRNHGVGISGLGYYPESARPGCGHRRRSLPSI